MIENNKKVSGTVQDYALYLDELNKHNIPRAEEYLQKMFMLDYIILNEDRHLTNFGIIRNVEILEWESICPIFDTGRSNNINISEPYWNWNEGEVKSFTENFISSEKLLDLFTIPLKYEQLENLKNVGKEFEKFYMKMREKNLIIEK